MSDESSQVDEFEIKRNGSSSLNHLCMSPVTSLYFSFAFSLIMCLMTGTLFVFPVYAVLLQARLGRTTVTLLNALGHVGDRVVILIGLIAYAL